MFKRLVLSAALGLCCFIGEAQADIINVIYDGTLGTISDPANHFGGATVNLSGSAISVDFTFDSSLSPAIALLGGSGYSGGSLYPDKSPALKATITINGKSVTFAGSDFGTIAETNVGGVGFQSHDATAPDQSYVSSEIQIAANAPLTSVFGNFSYQVGPNDTGFGSFGLADNTSADFTPTSISQTISTVPLPSALPMFGVALIGLGFASLVRHRGAKTA